MRQLYHATIGDFQKPIQLHDRNKRPTQETCENCHWRENYVGTVEKTFTSFLADEENTPWTIRMELNVGGGDPVNGAVEGVHWHKDLANRVEFITEDNGATIPWMRSTTADGKVTEFRIPDFTRDPAAHEINTMDCMDCHNRPAHQFSSPNDAVDLAMKNGRIDPTMPWAKMKSVEALEQTYTDREQAKTKIAEYLRAEYPDDKRVDRLIAEVQSIYQLNFFPEMDTNWKSYPDHLSHKDWAGCFRCHDGNHMAADGETTLRANDCNSCHTILAQGSTAEELEKLDAKGYDFLHVDFEYSDFDCADCHTGGNQEEEEYDEEEEEDE